jgi:hypothetical protein
MNTIQNGKGSRPRNNWGKAWTEGFEAIDWHWNKETKKGDKRKSDQYGPH